MPFLPLLHAALGLIALVVAPLAMMARKGGDWHRRWGKAYFWSMAGVCATAVALGATKGNWLMAMVGVFSFQLVAGGYRALYLKKLHEGQRPKPMDRAMLLIAGVVNSGLLIWGIVHIALGAKGSAPILFTVFGLIGLLFVWRDLQRFYKMSHDKREWLYAHMSGFLGGYIATVSAFSAVNLDGIRPEWLQWLWPTLVGSPLITVWIGYYRRRFAEGRKSRELFDIRIRVKR